MCSKSFPIFFIRWLNLNSISNKNLYNFTLGAEYEYAKFFELNGGSVSLHTITHKTYKNSGKERWEAELENNYKSIIELGYVNDIPGARTPYLSFDNDYLQIIKTMGLKYDSSMFQCKTTLILKILNNFNFFILILFSKLSNQSKP